jgi:hypothetical protein
MKEAAEREQLLLQEREDLKQKVSHSCLTPHEQFLGFVNYHRIFIKNCGSIDRVDQKEAMEMGKALSWLYSIFLEQGIR